MQTFSIYVGMFSFSCHYTVYGQEVFIYFLATIEILQYADIYI